MGSDIKGENALETCVWGFIQSRAFWLVALNSRGGKSMLETTTQTQARAPSRLPLHTEMLRDGNQSSFRVDCSPRDTDVSRARTGTFSLWISRAQYSVCCYQESKKKKKSLGYGSTGTWINELINLNPLRLAFPCLSFCCRLVQSQEAHQGPYHRVSKRSTNHTQDWIPGGWLSLCFQLSVVWDTSLPPQQFGFGKTQNMFSQEHPPTT